MNDEKIFTMAPGAGRVREKLKERRVTVEVLQPKFYAGGRVPKVGEQVVLELGVAMTLQESGKARIIPDTAQTVVTDWGDEDFRGRKSPR